MIAPYDRFTGLLAGALVCLGAIARMAAAADSPPSLWRPLDQITIEQESWRWNWGSWDQEKIATFGDYQYTVFWDAKGVFVLARRDLRDNRVQTLHVPQFKLSSDDPHRNTCLGISRADGRLHVSWDHHGNPLRYARSRAGLLTRPPERLTAEDLEPARPLLADPKLESRVTYPRFFNDCDGNLFLCYRLGGSGSGSNYLHRYHPETSSWTRIGMLFGSQGTYAPWQNSTARNAYLHDLIFDARNRLHASWVFREAGATWASNHDLHYAYSDDHGVTWCNNAGQKIADLAAGDPIELADPGIVVRPIPVFSWLMNTGCMAVDSKNRPHVVTYKLPVVQRPEKLHHDPPLEIRKELRFAHYWRSDDGTWLGGEPIDAGPAGAYACRGDMVFDRDDRLYFFFHPYGTTEGFRCLEAGPADQWRAWSSYALARPELTADDASKHDRARWSQQGILSFTARVGRSGFGIADFTLRPAGSKP